MDVSKQESIVNAQVLSVVTTPHVNSVHTKEDGQENAPAPMMRLNNTFSKTYLQSYIHLRDSDETSTFFQSRGGVNHRRSKTQHGFRNKVSSSQQADSSCYKDERSSFQMGRRTKQSETLNSVLTASKMNSNFNTFVP